MRFADDDGGARRRSSARHRRAPPGKLEMLLASGFRPARCSHADQAFVRQRDGACALAQAKNPAVEAEFRRVYGVAPAIICGD